MPYLNVAEVESALSLAAGAANAAFTQLVTLPYTTWEGRQCHALKIASGSGGDRCGVYFLGGVHAREWGSPDILINFVEVLCQAYRTNSGVTIGPKSFTAAQIQSIVNTLDVLVFPQANPDGRNYSMTVDPLWRKNRRPSPGPGVDINRNYDWLWNYPAHFSASAPVVSSTVPSDETYIGPSAASEPETRNVVWMHDTYPSIRYFMDVHSFSEDILYTWGDDDNQSTDTAKNFQNAAYDTKRGITTVSGLSGAGQYAEFIPAADQSLLITLADRMRAAIQAVRGRNYKVLQSASGLYVTSGTSDDYAYARHFVDASRGKVLSYTLEWGPYNPADVAGSFHPLYSEMQNIIQEITAGLIEFCLGVVDQCKPHLNFDWRKYATLIYILFGVIQDGGGLGLTPGGHPVPIDPWGPLMSVLEPGTKQALIGLLVRELGALVEDPVGAKAMEALGAALVRTAMRQMGTPGKTEL